MWISKTANTVMQDKVLSFLSEFQLLPTILEQKGAYICPIFDFDPLLEKMPVYIWLTVPGKQTSFCPSWIMTWRGNWYRSLNSSKKVWNKLPMTFKSMLQHFKLNQINFLVQNSFCIWRKLQKCVPNLECLACTLIWYVFCRISAVTLEA